MPKFLSGRLTLRAALCSTTLLLPLAGMADPAPNAPPTAPAAPATQPATPATPGAKFDDERARRRADRQAYFAAHLAALHAGLQLTPDQESLWAPVATALTGLSKLHHRHHHGEEEGRSIDELKQQGQRLIARGEAIGKLADATGPLVASLTVDQKGRLPVLLDGLKPRHLLARAFAVDAERDGMRDHRWRDRWDRSYAGRDEMDRGGGDHGEMDRDRGGWGYHNHHHWDRYSKGDGGAAPDDHGFDQERHGHYHPDDNQGEDGDRT